MGTTTALWADLAAGHAPFAPAKGPFGSIANVAAMTDVRWIELDGAVNVRDLGGLPTGDGRVVARDRLIRADNLQGLSDSDVRRLVDEHGVRAVADLRTETEIESEGPGPMTRERNVTIHNLSLLPEAGRNTDAAADDQNAPVLLVWQTHEDHKNANQRGAAGHYLGYLDDRADSIVGALRLIAHSDGATIVHCAAGKDRTGVVVALALAEVGVRREAIVGDYARTAERLEAIFIRLGASPTYFDDVADEELDKHRPKAATMAGFLALVDELHGGPPAWLRTHGWAEEDSAALRRKLIA